MTYSLYYSPGAASMAVHWMLIEMVIPFDARLIDIDVGAQRTDEYRRLNPSGRVPTLLMLLAEHHPVAVLAPAPGSSDRAEWLVNAREGLTDWSNSAHSANDNV